MSDIDKAIEFLQGGVKGGLWDMLAVVCGNCHPIEDCDEGEKCAGLTVISQMEEQIAKSGLAFMKQQAREWIKCSIVR